MPEFKLKDRDGKEQTYNRDVITVPGTNGEKLPFSYGEAQSEVPIELDFTDGDMEVTAGNGTLVKSAVIKKPTDLEPENVRYSKKIGGVVGTFLGDTEEIIVDGDTELNFSEGDFVIKPTDETKVISKTTITKPINLTPENIAEGVEIAGIIGTMGGGGGGFTLDDEVLKYFTYTIDGDKKTITLFSVNYSSIYANTGSYDVNIPDKICGLDVIIAI